MSENNKGDDVVCIHLLNGNTIICRITNLKDNWVSVSMPYLFALNQLDDKTIQFIPYLNEFTNDTIFDINVNMVVSIFQPHEKYKFKYIEFTQNENKKTLLNG